MLANLFRPRCCTLYVWLLVLLHSAAAGVLLALAQQQLGLYGLLPLILMMFCYAYRDACFSLPNSVRQLGCVNHHWFVVTPAMGIVEVSPLSASVMTRYLMLLYFKARHSQHCFRLFLLAGSLPSEQLRQLRVQLALHQRTGKQYARD